MRAAAAAALTGALASIACASGARGQDIAQRIKQVDSGTVQVVFASRPDVCGDGENFIRTAESNGRGRTNYLQSRRGITINNNGSGDYEPACLPGPVRVALTVEHGKVVDLDTYVGGRPPAGAVAVSTKAAVSYLLDLAEHDGADVGKRAILPTLLADSVEPWPELLRLARNESVDRDVRKTAIFWLGQAAGDKATAGLKSLLSDDDVEIRKHVVFALSQLKGEQSVDALIDVARNNKDPDVRKTALFWLSQKNDPRVLALYEEILLKK